MLPDPLIRIQFRRVGWEALQMDYFRPAIGQEVFDLRRTIILAPPQITRSLLPKYPYRCRKKATLSKPVKARARVRVANCPADVMPLITDRGSRVWKTLRIGASPHGAYVLTTPAHR